MSQRHYQLFAQQSRALREASLRDHKKQNSSRLQPPVGTLQKHALQSLVITCAGFPIVGRIQIEQRYESQIPVIDRALETAALMLGSDRSRGYCLEMICADFLAGANLDNGDPETLLFSATRFFRFLPEAQKQAFLKTLTEKAA